MTQRARHAWRWTAAGVAAGCGLGAGVMLGVGHALAAAVTALAGLAAAVSVVFIRPQPEGGLAESEDRFRQLSDAAFEGVIIHDGGRVLDVNQAFARMSGFTARELVGRDVLSLLAPESHEAARRHLAEAYEPLREYVSLHKDGSRAPMECQARGIVWNGRPARVVAVRDLTDRKRAEAELRESHDLARALLNAPSELACLFDDRGRILAANDTAAVRMGRRPEELPGLTLFDLFSPELAAARMARMEEVIRTAKPVRFEDCREGHYYRNSMYPVPDESGRVRRIAVFAQDVTQLRLREEALLRAKAEWERTFDAVPDLIATIDDQYRITRVNRAMAERLGLKSGEVVGRTCFDCVHGMDRPPDFCPHAMLMKDGAEHVVEVSEERLRGDFLVSVSPLRDAEGRLIGSVHIARDVTERRRAETALREREALYRSILDTSRDAIVLADVEGRVLLANRSADEMYGAGRIAGMNGADLIAPDDRERVLASMTRLFETGGTNSVEFLCRRADGSGFPAEINASLVKDAAGRPTGVVAVVRDITDRKRSDEQIERTGRLLASIGDAQSLYISGHDPRQVFDAMLDTLLRMTGSDHGFLAEVVRDEHGVARQPLTTRVLAWDAESARLVEVMAKKGVTYSTLNNLAGEAALTGKTVICNNVPGRPEARPLPADHPPLRSFMGVPLFFGGDLVGVAGIANCPGGYDERTAEFLRPFTVTLAGLIHASRVERKERQALDALRESERRFREVMENVRLIAVTLDRERRITFCNAGLAELTGWTREEILGRDWFDLFVPEEVRAGVRDAFGKLLAGDIFVAHYENDIVTRRGDRRHIAWDNTLLRDAEGRVIGAASLGRDVTQQQKLEDQVRQAQKMEAVGKLAGGVAHDFNNMLAPILGWSDLLLIDMSPDDPRRESLLHVRLAAERARDLTRQLLAFSRKQVLQLRPVRLADVVRGFEKMLRRTIREDVRIRLALAEDSGAVFADIGQVEQVIANLAVNAQDAMPTGGDMTIEVANVEIDELWALQHPGDRPGSYVMLAVGDTGKGMPAQVREHLFEPFFTTKEVGRGTGLGLATVYGVVRQHGGTLAVESVPERGSTFRVYLPRVDLPAEKPPGEPLSAALPRGTETILVVEDNEMVRQLACEMLAQQGYRILSAATPEECLAVAESGTERIDLLLTDMIMPHVNGRDLYERLSRTIPGLRVVVMSGYADTLVSAEGTSAFGRHFLQKPFTLRALADIIRAALDEKL